LRRQVEHKQYVSIKFTERLAEAGVEPSVGSVGDSYDNALAETVNGLYKAEVIHRCGPWRSFEAVEFATLEWVDWSNNRRLLEPIGNIPPAEAGEQYYAMRDQLPMAARIKQNSLRRTRGGSVAANPTLLAIPRWIFWYWSTTFGCAPVGVRAVADQSGSYPAAAK
jgi:hypothetical protein